MIITKFNKQDLLNNIDLFCDLYKKTFTASVSKEIIEQRYLANPYEDLLMYVALDEGKIVANYSAVPIRIQIDGNDSKAALSLNTMTDPEYMGKRLFTTLANALYEDLKKEGYALIIGFPNYISNRTFNSYLGWKTLYEIPTLKLSLDDYREDKPMEGFFDDSFGDIDGKSDNQYIHVSLNKDYLNWRFRDNKEKQYQVLAADSDNWLIYQFYNDEVNITVNNCSDFSKEKVLIAKLITIGKQKKCKFVTTWCKANTISHSYLERLGFRLSGPIRTFGMRCFDKEIEEKVSDYRNWKIQMGDDNTY